MATATAQPAPLQFRERVAAPEELVALMGAEKLRKLHAVLLRGYQRRQQIEFRLRRAHGDQMVMVFAPEEAL